MFISQKTANQCRWAENNERENRDKLVAAKNRVVHSEEG